MIPSTPGSRRDRYAIGVDVGGTKIEFALVSEQGQVLNTYRLPSLPSEGPDAVFDRIAEGVHRLLDLAEGNVVGVGVGCPGHLNPQTGVVYNATNLSWVEVPLKDEVGRRLPADLPLWVRKDADAAALGEMYFGAARGIDSFVLLTVGTGLGGGAVSQGRVVTGAHFNGMEVGHIPLNPQGRQCVCGMYGCPEIYVAGVGLMAAARDYLPEYPDGALATVPEITTAAILDAARAGDAMAARIMAEAVKAMAEMALICMGFFDPSRIVMGGGLAHAAPDFYVEGVARDVWARRHRLNYLDIKIVASQVLSSAVGAACLVWHGLYEHLRG